MTADPLLLLAAPSRESQDKAQHFAAAAAALAVAARIVVADSSEQIMKMAMPGGGIRFALACSDALAPAAAALNQRFATGGMTAGPAARLIDKAVGIPWLSHLLDLPPLPQLLPLTPAALRDWAYRGPVMVKPTRSAGGWSPRPWGYRVFADAAALLCWLEREKLATAFFAEQASPGPLGPALLQAAVDGRRIAVASVLLTPNGATVFSRGQGDFEAGAAAGHGRRWRRALYAADAAPLLAERLARLTDVIRAQPGWGRALLHVQGIATPAGLHLTDINLRLSTAWDWLMAAADPDVHRRLLAALLFDAPLEIPQRAAAMAIDLVHGDCDGAIRRIVHPPAGPDILPWRMTPAACGRAAQGFDRAGAAPSFITLGDSIVDCERRAERFRAGVRLVHATEAAA